FGSDVATFTYHRSFSHSLFVLALVMPAVVWLIRRVHPSEETRRGWYALVYLCFATHVLLDALTIYGTQIFWPLSTTPVSIGSVFIIDPLYTVPLLVGVGLALALRRSSPVGHRANAIALTLSTAYLAWGLAAKFWVQHLAAEALDRQGLASSQHLALAGPFTTLLWRVVSMHDGGYRVGWYSLIAGGERIAFTDYPSEEALLDGLDDHWPVARLRWFTHGFYGVNAVGNDVVLSDLRMGVEGSYVFRFVVAERGETHSRPLPGRLVSEQPDLGRIGEVWELLLDANGPANRPAP
ncbi:MAG: metal-dependent hydrolase, partial [Pseudomonadota bacterium]